MNILNVQSWIQFVRIRDGYPGSNNNNKEKGEKNLLSYLSWP